MSRALLPRLAWAAVSLLAACSALAAPPDSRTELPLSPTERAEFLAGMRTMLGSVQGIVQGIAASDREAIARHARISGNRMARATPAAVRAKLPKGFQDLGGPTHLMFEELAVRAETDDMDQIARHLAETMQLCMTCHAAFRVR